MCRQSLLSQTCECAGYSRKSGSRLGGQMQQFVCFIFSMLITWRRYCEKTKSRVQSPEEQRGRGSYRREYSARVGSIYSFFFGRAREKTKLVSKREKRERERDYGVELLLLRSGGCGCGTQWGGEFK